jgi:hypothetical protein
MTARQKWTLVSFQFLKQHVTVRTETRQLGKVPEARGPEEEDEEGPDDDDAAPTDSQSITIQSQSLSQSQSQSQSQNPSSSIGSSDAVAPKTSRSGRRPPRRWTTSSCRSPNNLRDRQAW